MTPGKIPLERRCASSYQRRQNQLQSHHQLYRQPLHRHQPILALHSIFRLRRPQNEGFCQLSANQILPSDTQKTSACPPTPGPHQYVARKLPSNIRQPTPHLSLTTKENEPSNTLLKPSSITQKSTCASKLHSTNFYPRNPNRHKKQ